MKKVYQALAELVLARQNCLKSNDGNWEWVEKHTSRINSIVRENLPSGGGFDNGTTIDLEQSTPEKLVFHTSFHHMNDDGFYTEWTAHTVTVIPSLVFDFTLRISGPNRKDIKTYIGELFNDALDAEIED